MANNPSALITGINGFVGVHLATHLHSNGFTLYGTDIEQSCRAQNVQHYFPADIRQQDTVKHLVSQYDYTYIFHLAAMSHLPQADRSPRQAMEVNLLGTISLLDALLASRSSARVLIVGSSKQYGEHPQGPVTEDSELLPSSFYGISKMASELCARQYHQHQGIDLCFTRSFNHTGPGQSPQFVCSEWARQVTLIQQNKIEPVIKTGDIDESIDFTDVRDVVNAYRLILQKGKSGEAYNVCSGEAVPLPDILRSLTSKSQKEIRIESAPGALPKSRRNKSLRGDNSKLISHTGWTRAYDLEETLEDLYNYWLKTV